MKVLFVCSANKQRSKTAEDHFSIKYPEHEFLSAGTNKKICQQEGTTLLDDELLTWADIVFAMEEKHRTIIRQCSDGNNLGKIRVLKISDIYKYNSPLLIEILEEKVKL